MASKLSQGRFFVAQDGRKLWIRDDEYHPLDPAYWRSADDRVTRIQDLEDEHLGNILQGVANGNIPYPGARRLDELHREVSYRSRRRQEDTQFEKASTPSHSDAVYSRLSYLAAGQKFRITDEIRDHILVRVDLAGRLIRAPRGEVVVFNPSSGLVYTLDGNMVVQVES